MYWRDYKVDYSNINIETNIGFESNKILGKIISEYRDRYMLKNDRPYNRCQNRKVKTEHYTVWLNADKVTAQSAKDMGKFVMIWQAKGFTVQYNEPNMQSIPQKTHFHLIRPIKSNNPITKAKEKIKDIGERIAKVRETNKNTKLPDLSINDQEPISVIEHRTKTKK